MELEFVASALRDLKHVPEADRRRMRDRLAAYAATPRDPRHDVAKLVNRPELYRLRAGDWRAIFQLKGEVVRVLEVRHRREIYR